MKENEHQEKIQEPFHRSKNYLMHLKYSRAVLQKKIEKLKIRCRRKAEIELEKKSNENT